MHNICKVRFRTPATTKEFDNVNMNFKFPKNNCNIFISIALTILFHLKQKRVAYMIYQPIFLFTAMQVCMPVITYLQGCDGVHDHACMCNVRLFHNLIRNK